MRIAGQPRGQDWTDTEIERLLSLRTDGMSFLKISKLLGRTCNSVRSKWYLIKNVKGKDKVCQSWSHEETELLLALAETLPRTKLLTTYNNAAVKNGFMKRSLPSISAKLFQLGQSLKPQTGWYSARAVYIGLGFSRQKMNNWIKGGLKTHKEGTNIYIRNDNLVKFILDHPTCLNGICEDGLQWFLALLKEEKEMRGYLGRPEYDRALSA